MCFMILVSLFILTCKALWTPELLSTKLPTGVIRWFLLVNIPSELDYQYFSLTSGSRLSCATSSFVIIVLPIFALEDSVFHKLFSFSSLNGILFCWAGWLQSIHTKNPKMPFILIIRFWSCHALGCELPTIVQHQTSFKWFIILPGSISSSCWSIFLLWALFPYI